MIEMIDLIPKGEAIKAARRWAENDSHLEYLAKGAVHYA